MVRLWSCCLRDYSWGGKGSRIAKGLKGSYEILDGVRRAKAAELLGHKTIPATIAGHGNQIFDLPIDALKSPYKTKIDVSDQDKMDRWMKTFKKTKEGSVPPPIQVESGNNGISIEDITFDTFGE